MEPNHRLSYPESAPFPFSLSNLFYLPPGASSLLLQQVQHSSCLPTLKKKKKGQSKGKFPSPLQLS